MKKIIRELKVQNRLGLHARPATMIAQSVKHSQSQVSLSYQQETIDARSVISILMLAIESGSLITLTAEGNDAEETMQKLVGVFEARFGEMEEG